jgi:hypothetical protein
MRRRRIRREALWWIPLAVVGVLLVFGVLKVAGGVSTTLGRWWQERVAASAKSPKNQPVNLAVVGVESARSKKAATGLALVQIVPLEKKVRGVSVPGGTFVEVPGQGFERASDALKTGPETVMATVGNLFGVPVEKYVILEVGDYKALTDTGVGGVLFARPVETNVTDEERARLAKIAAAVPPGDALVVPLPVKTISIAGEVYFEAQKKQIADVLKAWWGVQDTPEKRAVRIKILNGNGLPGVGGDAAKVLIKAGFRVVDTSNARDFRYAKTKVIVYRASKAQVSQIRKLLGVGQVEASRLEQDVVDVVVVLGKDYKPKKG